MKQCIIDVREPAEFALDHVAGALNIPSSRLLVGAPELSTVPKDAELVVYCKTGTRSALAIALFRALGYENVVNGINKEQVRARLASGEKTGNTVD